MNHERITYAFGHLVASHNPEDPHYADSGDLADDVMHEEGLHPREQELVELLAEHVAGNYTYTGEAAELARRIKEGTF